MRQLVTSSNGRITATPASNLSTHTLLVDGTYLMKRSFTATENSQEYRDRRGVNYGPLYLFMTTLRMIVRTLGVNKVMIMWDGEHGGKLRHDIYPEYKANREGKEWYNKTVLTESQAEEQKKSKRTLLAQRMRVKAYCEELFIRQVEAKLVEGDDLIAYYCMRYHDREKITIYTDDADALGLTEYDNVGVYLARKKQVFNKHNYFLHFDYHHTNAYLVKAFCGCSSDNIKGIDGLGEKTLFNHFPALKERRYSYHELILEADRINTERQAGKGKLKKPRLKVLDAMVNGTVMQWNTVQGKEVPVDLGEDFFTINYKLVNLMEPMMTPEAVEELEAYSELPLDQENRGSKNLLRLMNEDSFLTGFGDNFQKYVEVFYPVILREKEFAKKAAQD